MKNSEEAVRRVLESLRDVEAPTGMESRIVLALERRAVEPAQDRKLFLLSSLAMRSLAGGVAFAGLACAVLWMPKVHRSGPMPAASRLVQELALVSDVSMQASRLQRTGGRLQKAKGVRVSATPSPSDALALAETHAPSQPATPLPLTEQEKLLLRVARRHDPEQMAMLNPEMRDKQELQAKIEFQAFFEPVRLAEEKQITDSTIKKGDTQ